ncbi:MAG: winged helix-turn-helix transcriptional regulator [Mycobacteriales bacterium]
MRSYGDPCGIARGLDLIGERWALLVVRELLLGPKRFTDLRAGLPAASPNVLSQRLRELEDSGVVGRRRLDPPAATWVYELTGWGRELEPVLLHLGRWGSQVEATATAEMSADALMIALKTAFDPAAAGDLRARYGIRLGDAAYRVAVDGGRLDIVRGSADRPDAAVETDVTTLRGLAFRRRTLDEAEHAGTVTVGGDRRAVVRLLGLFPPPHQPAPP